MVYQVNAASVEWNPSTERLRELTEKMPNSQLTEFGNVAVKARVDSRSTKSTYIVEDSTNASKQTITRAEYDRVAAAQDAYIAGQDVVVVDGYIGPDPDFRTKARLIMEASNANVAGMQKQLYYPVGDEYDPGTWEPDTTVVYTPNLPVPGYPNDRLIAVDLNTNVTRVMNSDYFGESKKGGLRMWNNIVYNRGGLSLHAGCKVIPVEGRNRTVLIVGLSGTGKTTTTFTSQLGSRPAQDDFVALMRTAASPRRSGWTRSSSRPSTTPPPSRTPTWRTSRSPPTARSTSSTPPTPRTAARPGRSPTSTRGRPTSWSRPSSCSS